MNLKDFIQYKDIDLPDLTSAQAKEVEKQKDIKAKIIQVLKFINDPELTKVSIWDLGLIHKIDILNDHLLIEMTFTNANCPMSGAIELDIKAKILKYIKTIKTVEIKTVFQPPWSKNMMSDEAKLQLDIWE